ncbi:MAG TPA: methyltransferase domain-containing protein [Bryobacteraceae bacterium]|jgi:SAM-dependent methyltransferase|nr:methyltransferase domain-containing protein [Bryobacteraceae bacterium]
MAISLEQHNIEIHQNRQFWEKKAVLRKVYSEFYREIAARLNPAIPGLIVELGSGMGNVKDHIPNCITTDIFPNPWLDRVENAYELNFQRGELSHLILFDVWHHLQHPGTALQEFSRVLGPRGRIIIFDPAMGLVGRFVFGCFHHEPLGLEDEIQWDAPAGFSGRESAYYAAQGNASRVFGSDVFRDRLLPWRIAEIKYFSGLAYVASGGFQGPQLYPEALWPCLNVADSILSRIPKLASRMLVVLEKQAVERERTT